MSLRALAVALATMALAGCGSDVPPPRPPAPVRLTVQAPLDTATVDAETVEVRGSVTPAGAHVLVDGDEAAMDDGSFSATVSLEPGVNVIDVVAGAPRRTAAMTAVRVVRRVLVDVPDLDGESPDDAARRLDDLGLVAKVRDTGGLIDDLLVGADPRVCATEPPAGDRVETGTSVTVEVAKVC